MGSGAGMASVSGLLSKLESTNIYLLDNNICLANIPKLLISRGSAILIEKRGYWDKVAEENVYDVCDLFDDIVTFTDLRFWDNSFGISHQRCAVFPKGVKEKAKFMGCAKRHHVVDEGVSLECLMMGMCVDNAKRKRYDCGDDGIQGIKNPRLE